MAEQNRFDDRYNNLFEYLVKKYSGLEEEITKLLVGASNLGADEDQAYDLVRTAFDIDWY